MVLDGLKETCTLNPKHLLTLMVLPTNMLALMMLQNGENAIDNS
jgi:hypothetical protein